MSYLEIRLSEIEKLSYILWPMGSQEEFPFKNVISIVKLSARSWVLSLNYLNSIHITRNRTPLDVLME